MGLFGYGERDYVKNSTIFKDQLTNILYEVGRMKDAATDELVGAKINDILFSIAKQSNFPADGNKDVLKQVDERTADLLTKMRKDLQNGDAAKLIQHATMLSTTVNSLRKYGAEMPDARMLDAQDKLAEVQGIMNQLLNERVSVKERMKEIERQSDKILDDDDPRLDALEREYEDCEERLASLASREDVCRQNYAEIRDVMNSYGEEATIDEMPEVLNPKELQQHFSKLQRKQEAYYEKKSINRGVINEYKEQRNQARGTTTGESSLRAKRRLNAEAGVGSAIDGAKVESQSSETGTRRRFGSRE